MSKNDGGAAFPQPCMPSGSRAMFPSDYGAGGMSLRDWFAGMAACGIAEDCGDACEGYAKQRARVAYMIADAMLAESEKSNADS